MKYIKCHNNQINIRILLYTVYSVSFIIITERILEKKEDKNETFKNNFSSNAVHHVFGIGGLPKREEGSHLFGNDGNQ